MVFVFWMISKCVLLWSVFHISPYIYVDISGFCFVIFVHKCKMFLSHACIFTAADKEVTLVIYQNKHHVCPSNFRLVPIITKRYGWRWDCLLLLWNNCYSTKVAKKRTQFTVFWRMITDALDTSCWIYYSYLQRYRNDIWWQNGRGQINPQTFLDHNNPQQMRNDTDILKCSMGTAGQLWWKSLFAIYCMHLQCIFKYWYHGLRWGPS